MERTLVKRVQGGMARGPWTLVPHAMSLYPRARVGAGRFCHLSCLRVTVGRYKGTIIDLGALHE